MSSDLAAAQHELAAQAAVSPAKLRMSRSDSEDKIMDQVGGDKETKDGRERKNLNVGRRSWLGSRAGGICMQNMSPAAGHRLMTDIRPMRLLAWSLIRSRNDGSNRMLLAAATAGPRRRTT